MTSDEPPAVATELLCPWCQGAFGITLDMEGSTVHCPHCEGEVTIPSRGDLVAMLPPPIEPPPTEPPPTAPPVTSGGFRSEPPLFAPSVDHSSEPPIVAKSADPPPKTPVTVEANVSRDDPPAVVSEPVRLPPGGASPGLAVSPEIAPPKVVHAQSRDGDVVAFQARGKVIHTQQGDVELRERSREERSFRRSVRNIVLAILCMAILFGFPAWLMTRKAKPLVPPAPAENSTDRPAPSP